MDFYIFEDTSDLENLPLLNIELQDAYIFTTINEKNEEQKSTLQIFLKDITGEKKLEVHKHSWLLIIWIFKK